MLKVVIPKGFEEEKEYVLHVLLKEVLHISNYTISIDLETDYYIFVNGSKEVLIEDIFFSKVDEDYLTIDNIPEHVIHHEYKIDEEVFPSVILYGESSIKQEGNRFVLGSDIIASSFFMLTRWEEYVHKDKDRHNRFEENMALSVKHNFIERPIVNEYASLLSYLLSDKEHEIGDKRTYRIFNTCDVDVPRLWNPYSGIFIKKILGSLFKRRDINEFWFYLSHYRYRFFQRKNDPYYTFDYLMDVSDKFDIKSYFFFLVGGETRHDRHCDFDSPYISELINSIKERKHNIGFHPSYNTFSNGPLFNKELKYLENRVGNTINYGRQHILRFDVPTTWNIWNDAGMKWDSTLCYPSFAGFRCGICQEYTVFDFIKRKALNLKEIPLTAMEVSLVARQQLEPDEVLAKIKQLSDVVKKYNGDFVLLWHNSSFNIPIWRKYNHVYEKAIEILVQKED